MRIVFSLIGALLVLLVLFDVFLTVLYARIGKGMVSHTLACLTWKVFRFASRVSKIHGDMILSFCGPAILVLNVIIWLLLMTVGSAMIYYPALGTEVRATDGKTSREFSTAMYIAGNSMTTVGTSDYAPHHAFYKLWYVADSIMGITIITLTLTYYLEIYNALNRRNTLALKLQTITAGTGDATELLVGIGPRGRFDLGYAQLAEIAAECASMKESLHFYPVLFYFRFREPHYAPARMMVIVLDSVTLIKSALDDEEYRWLKESGAVEQIWRTNMMLLNVVSAAFLTGGAPEPEPIDPSTDDRWRDRYMRGVQRLRSAGIVTTADLERGAENYLALRARWNRYIVKLAEHMARDIASIDRPGSDPRSIDDEQSIEQRLHAFN